MDDRQHMELLQRQMINNGKTWEYNYIITAPTGVVWEVAGEFQSAHCLNANSFAYGCQMNLGVGAAPNQDMVDSWRWLRAELVARGQLTATHAAKPHYWLRDTACCGAMMATAPGGSWASPTGQGHVGDLLPFMLVPWAAPPPLPGGWVLTPEDKAYIDSKFEALWQQTAADHRGIMRAPENSAITQGNVRAVVAEAATFAIIKAAVEAAGQDIDPAVIEAAIAAAIAAHPVQVNYEAIADAVVDEEHARLAE
jgi:hypothetical protein